MFSRFSENIPFKIDYRQQIAQNNSVESADFESRSIQSINCNLLGTFKVANQIFKFLLQRDYIKEKCYPIYINQGSAS